MTCQESYSEQDLAHWVSRGDNQAMKVLYQRYVGYLSAVCSRYIRDDDQVKDILQEAFLKIFRGMDRFRYQGEGSLRAWMARIVLNDTLKVLRKKKTVPLIRDLPDREDVPAPDFQAVPLKELQRMIRELPDGYRTVFNLYVMEDKSHKEIARLLGIKENSSASQLHHAKAMLAKSIHDYMKRREYDG